MYNNLLYTVATATSPRSQAAPNGGCESRRNTFSGGQCSFDAKRTLLMLEATA